MESFAAALQVAAMVESPPRAMLESIHKNLALLGVDPPADVLSAAPPVEWRETAIEVKSVDSAAAPAQKKQKVSEDFV